MEQHVAMTEDLVEKLTPSKEMSETQPDEKNKILEGIAEVGTCNKLNQCRLSSLCLLRRNT